ncbi:MAG: hypothetical protein HC844_09135 [Tabrizicola sp.]|nr:hypothetical protein [Tabrizicola sp.]
MQNRSEPDTRFTPNLPPQPRDRSDRGGIGFALFLVLAGLVLLAERLGWVPNDFDWLFPVILIAWGFGELYRRFS